MGAVIDAVAFLFLLLAIAAVPWALHARGYRLVTVSELLAHARG